ncbi:glycoside hydrolase family 38 N-terminal domain-containing protein [Ructibacterium gallinarum]|uniref:Glycoside hydrolase family 38 central domain-containing protein n=1 Tax=Ructibacterium gallinarum TaxID=2779355 RepID=A0A9D5R901_9FIRM|nr:glycoside hydrolase family 38 C-terminal domain-containing protein [Ructibacterium gallinarum]MBE5040946.1 hypothetical protein [Ructibacterium gallinarum]
MNIFFFSGTHWDREWYQPFQGFRFRLVKMIDQLIEGLENDDFGVFHFDGQTIILEDYLEIRPENKARLEKLIANGKILVGPWYCMPDEFLMSGESIIRNLQKGYQIARSYGAEPLKYGYICDIFGHIAQMPQIFCQLGIHNALLGRGTNESTTDMHFKWQSPDGSWVTTFKLQDSQGYGSFAAYVIGDETQAHLLSEEELKKRIKAHTDSEIARSNVPVILLMDAIDHASYHKDTKKYLKILSELYPQADIKQTSVMEMCELLKKYEAGFQTKYGELREPAKTHGCGYLHLITHTLSSRYPLKKYNDQVQTLLEKWITPLYAFRKTNQPLSYLELSEKYLLMNQAHDSICGCGIDQIHKDMVYRFDQARIICEQLLDEFRTGMEEKQETDNIVLKIWNPLPYAYRGVTQIDISFPQDYKTTYCEPFGYESINSFKIFDSEDNEIPYGIENIVRNYQKRTYNQYVSVSDLYTVSIHVELIPMGITELIIKPFTESSRYLTRMTQSETGAENEFIKLEIACDGRLNIFDKQTGTQYNGLLGIADDGEIGDGWYHANPACDTVITNSMCEIRKVVNTCNRVVFEVIQKMMVPREMLFENRQIRRSSDNVQLELRHYITLDENAQYVSVKTKIQNTAKDHRIRIKIPTGVAGNTYFANQAFCFVERQTGVDTATQTWMECEVPEKQMSGIVLKKDNKKGLAFISAYGLHECAVHENGDIYVTLFRSFQKTVMTNGEPGGQLLEEMEFSYRILPFGPNVVLADLQKHQDAMQAGFLVSQCKKDTANKHASEMVLTAENTVFSTAVPCENGLDIRLYQLSNCEETAILTLPTGIVQAQLVSLDGQITDTVTISDNTVKIPMKPWQIQTIRLFSKK